MKAYGSIEDLAEEVGISARQGWRWLKRGKIRKVKNEDGRIVFVLVDEPADSDTDDTDNVTTDVSDMSPSDTEPITGLSTRRVDRKLSVRPGSLVQSMRDELEAAKVEFEIEKIEDARSKWQERKDRERLERAEQERIQRLEGLRVRETQRIQMEIEEREREVIQRVKEAILPLSMKQVFPAHIMASIYTEIEKTLSRMNLIGVPFDELIILGTDVKNRILGQNHEVVRQSVCEYLMALSRNGLRECLKQMYNDYREHGGELCYRDFILNNASSPDERERLLSLIAL